MILQELLHLPPLTLPVDGKIVTFEVRLPADWMKEAEQRLDELRVLAKRLGYEEKVPGASVESLLQSLLFFYLKSDGGWATLIGSDPD